MATGDVSFEEAILLKKVLKSALFSDGVARGLNEVVRSLDKREAHFCVLAKNCDEPSYKVLVQSLCQQHSIPLIEVDDKAELGEMIGQCKFDKDGKARKIVGCSAAVIKNYGRDEDAKTAFEKLHKISAQ